MDNISKLILVFFFTLSLVGVSIYTFSSKEERETKVVSYIEPKSSGSSQEEPLLTSIESQDSRYNLPSKDQETSTLKETKEIEKEFSFNEPYTDNYEELLYVIRDMYLYKNANRVERMNELEREKARYFASLDLHKQTFKLLQKRAKEGKYTLLNTEGYVGTFTDYPLDFEGTFYTGLRDPRDPNHVKAVSLPYKGYETYYHRKWEVELINMLNTY